MFRSHSVEASDSAGFVPAESIPAASSGWPARAIAWLATGFSSGSTNGIGFNSMPWWAKVMNFFHVIAGSVPPVMRRVAAKLSFPNQTMPT